MRRMLSRQAKRHISALFPLLIGLWACQPTQTPPTPTATFAPPLIIPSPLPTATATPLACLTQPGNLKNGEVPTNGSPTAFIIYLPPCYDQFTDQHYPVLYLLNGQTYNDDQWVRLGAPKVADYLILSRQSAPFIIVFPDDRYWNSNQGPYFGEFLVNDIVPYIDNNYRTIADREHRALGGLSRGGGWALHIAFTRPDLFGAIGLHSPAVFPDDRAEIQFWLTNFPAEGWPRIYLDSGDNDHERGYNTMLESLFTQYGVVHEWHLNTGAHDETYWSKNTLEYMQWYTSMWGTENLLP